VHLDKHGADYNDRRRKGEIGRKETPATSEEAQAQ